MTNLFGGKRLNSSKQRKLEYTILNLYPGQIFLDLGYLKLLIVTSNNACNDKTIGKQIRHA